MYSNERQRHEILKLESYCKTLEVDKRAEKFSECYYNELFKKRQLETGFSEVTLYQEIQRICNVYNLIFDDNVINSIQDMRVFAMGVVSKEALVQLNLFLKLHLKERCVLEQYDFSDKLSNVLGPDAKIDRTMISDQNIIMNVLAFGRYPYQLTFTHVNWVENPEGFTGTVVDYSVRKYDATFEIVIFTLYNTTRFSFNKIVVEEL